MALGLFVVTNGVPTAFLDRDGVINVPTGIPHTYITTWEDFHFIPGVSQAIKRLNQAGYRVVVVTNQRGVARGVMSRADLDNIHANMIAELEKQNAHIDAVYVCPHEGGCNCRKPAIGLLEQAADDAPVDLARSFMVGDSLSDIEAGKRFGIRTIFIATPDNAKNADYACSSLADAVDIMVKETDK